jgi:thiol-disulfide isomerase/thioredoxin
MPAVRRFRPDSARLAGAWSCVLALLWACEQPPPPAPAQPAPASAAALGASGEQPVPLDADALFERIRRSGKRATLVNVWASWCGNCKKEMPMLLRVAADVAPHGIGLMLVSADEPKDAPAAAAFLREHAGGRPGFIVDGRLGPFKRALHATWKGSIPSTFLFDSRGERLHTWLGPVYEHELQPVLQKFLAGELEPAGSGP